MAATAVVILDWRPEYLVSQSATTSLLLSPLGTTTLLRHLLAQLADIERISFSVIPNFEADDAYTQAITAVAADAAIRLPSGISTLLEQHEPADMLLIVDSQYTSADLSEYQLLMRGVPNVSAARHLVELRENTEGASERVVYDAEQRVRSIDRLYDGVTRLEAVGMSASLLSIAVARETDVSNLLCLTKLRTALASSGVPSRDLTETHGAVNLMRECGMLTLNERVISSDLAKNHNTYFSKLAADVWIGKGCEVASSARLLGPVIIHDNVKIGDDAVILGPATIGENVTVGDKAIISQSVLLSSTDIAADASVIQRIMPPDADQNRPFRADEDSLLSACSRSVKSPVGEQRRRVREIMKTRKRDRLYHLGKRAFDTLAAMLGLTVLSPLLIVVSAIVKLTSKGPVFFAHEREGKGGRVFSCWKFRTMVDHAHAQQRSLYQQNQVDGPQFKVDNDPRVTWIGKWLRSTNIDELPQLFNVVMGQMSLIGPRPSPFRENQICVPWRKARLSVRPGITGLWQVCRHERKAGDFHQWIYFDVMYVRHMGFWLDVKIFLATAMTLGGRWSVPLGWMVSERKRQPTEEIQASFVPTEVLNVDLDVCNATTPMSVSS